MTHDPAEPVHTLVLDASMIIGTDFTACDTVVEVNDELRERGIRLVLVQVRAHVRATMERGGVIETLGEDSIFRSIEEAVDSVGSDRD